MNGIFEQWKLISHIKVSTNILTALYEVHLKVVGKYFVAEMVNK